MHYVPIFTEQCSRLLFHQLQADQIKGQIKGVSRDGPTWRINLSFTEYHVYSLIDQYCRGLNFRHILVLMNIIRQENLDELYILNNEILVNTLFVISQKHIDKMRSKSDWIYRFLQAIVDGLKSGFLPSFYLPRYNLLDSYDIREKERKVAANKLKIILESIQDDPQTLYNFTGYDEDKKSKKGETADEVFESDNVGAPDLRQEDVKVTERRAHEMKTVYETEEEITEEGKQIYVDKPEEAAGSVLTKITQHSKLGERSDIY